MTKNFVFSSVGDNTYFDKLWINKQMDYDIYIIYYGNDEDIYEKYKSKVTYIDKRKGSKFQNFKYFYDNNKNIIDKYDRFFILDDDIIFNVKDIKELEEIKNCNTRVQIWKNFAKKNNFLTKFQIKGYSSIYL